MYVFVSMFLSFSYWVPKRVYLSVSAFDCVFDLAKIKQIAFDINIKVAWNENACNRNVDKTNNEVD